MAVLVGSERSEKETLVTRRYRSKYLFSIVFENFQNVGIDRLDIAYRSYLNVRRVVRRRHLFLVLEKTAKEYLHFL